MLSYCITDLHGERLDELNSNKELMPASNIKLFSAAAALEHLEPTSSPVGSAEIIKSSKNSFMLNLNGSLLFSFRNAKNDFAETVIKQIAQAIKLHNISRLSLHCPQEYFRPLKHYPCVSFLSYNENTLDVTCENRKIITNPKQKGSFKFVENPKIKEQSRSGNTIYYNPNQNSNDFWRVEDENWTAYQLQHKLLDYGIDVKVDVISNKLLGKVILSFDCPITTGELIKSSLTFSDNFRAEMLGLYLKDKLEKQNLNSCLNSLRKKIILQNTHLADASGLSRDNYSTSNDICNLLVFMKTHSHSKIWLDSMAVAGKAGTLHNASKFGLIQNTFKGKTGTLKDAKALSGYYINKKGKELCISVIQNDKDCSNFSESIQKILKVADER